MVACVEARSSFFRGRSYLQPLHHHLIQAKARPLFLPLFCLSPPSSSFVFSMFLVRILPGVKAYRDRFFPPSTARCDLSLGGLPLARGVSSSPTVHTTVLATIVGCFVDAEKVAAVKASSPTARSTFWFLSFVGLSWTTLHYGPMVGFLLLITSRHHHLWIEFCSGK